MPLTTAALRAANAENNPDPFLVLMTIKLAPEGEDVRVVNNTEDVTSRGQVFIACPFAIALPEASENVITNAEVQIDNVDTRIWQGVRALTFAPEVLLEVVLASAPSTVLIGTDGLKLRETTATQRTISGKLVPDSVWTAGFPAHDFDPAQFQGMFGTGSGAGSRFGVAPGYPAPSGGS